MKKMLLTTVLVLAMVLAVMPVQMANAVDFAVSANVPTASGVTITATEVNASTGVFGSTVTAMNFGTLSLNSSLGIWLPVSYFAVDVGVTTDGAGAPEVTLTYTEAASDKPTGQTNGLGHKSTATFVAVTGGPAPSDQTETELDKKLLKDVSGDEILVSEGFFRAYIAIYTGDDATLNTAGGEPFTSADEPGDYTGTLTVTAVVT